MADAVLWLTNICKDRRVIMHDVHSDFNAFGEHIVDVFGRSDIIDTQSRSLYGKRNLPSLALEHLDKDVQGIFHSSVENAQITGELWDLATSHNRDAALQNYMLGTNNPAMSDTQRKAAKQNHNHKAQTQSASTPALENQGSNPFPGQSSTSQSGPSTLTIINHGTIVENTCAVGGMPSEETQEAYKAFLKKRPQEPVMPEAVMPGAPPKNVRVSQLLSHRNQA